MFSEEPFGANDPYARQMDIFPRLAPEMMARIVEYGSQESIIKGSLLLEGGKPNADFLWCRLIASKDEERS